MKKFLIAAAAATAIATPAAAQEVSNFEGAKVGVVAGYDSYKISGFGDSGSQGGFHYGLTAGFDADVGGAILGVEAEVSDATTKESYDDGFDAISLAAGRELYLGARLGAVVTPSVLLYAKAGYVNSKLKLALDSGTYEVLYRGSDNLDGYRLGAGVEYAPSTLFGRVEYRFSDFGKRR